MAIFVDASRIIISALTKNLWKLHLNVKYPYRMRSLDDFCVSM